jgi:ribosome biogenesis protein MAK21
VKKGTKRAKNDLEDEDSEDSGEEFGNLDDDEISLGSMNDEDFTEIDEDGGTFMDILDDEGEGNPGKHLKKQYSNCMFSVLG